MSQRRSRGRLSGISTEIQTDLPCSLRQEYVRAIRIVSKANCKDRVVTCRQDKLVISADCNSKAASKRFQEEVDFVVQALQIQRIRDKGKSR